MFTAKNLTRLMGEKNFRAVNHFLGEKEIYFCGELTDMPGVDDFEMKIRKLNGKYEVFYGLNRILPYGTRFTKKKIRKEPRQEPWIQCLSDEEELEIDTITYEFGVIYGVKRLNGGQGFYLDINDLEGL